MHWIRRKIGDKIVWLDKADENIFYARQWYLSKKGYLRNSGGVMLHKIILRTQPGMQVDHINGNRLDNRRCNLREVTGAQNCQNRRACNKTGLKGVHSRGKKFLACIRIEGKYQYLGIYPTAHEAARVYDKAALEVFGEFSRLNFPLEARA